MKPIDRKQELVAQAAIHRQRVGQARQNLAAGLHAGALVKGAGGLALAALALFRNRKSASAPAGMAALLPLVAPLALRGLSFLGKVRPPKPAVRKLLIAGALGALTAFAIKKTGARRRIKTGSATSERQSERK